MVCRSGKTGVIRTLIDANALKSRNLWQGDVAKPDQSELALDLFNEPSVAVGIGQGRVNRGFSGFNLSFCLTWFLR